MAADSTVRFTLLHRTCKLVVLLCFLHISVTFFFYVRSLDIRFAFVQNQQSHNVSTQANRVVDLDFTSETEPKEGETKKAEPAELVPKEETGDESQAPEDEKKKAEEPEKKLEKCPETSPLLVGPLRIEFNTPVNLDQIKQMNPNVQPGGRFRPGDCVALAKVAIIIPFRRRDEHLKFWLFYLHPILQRQQLDYGVYVINQLFFSSSLFCAPLPLFYFGSTAHTPPSPSFCMLGASDQWLWLLELLRPAPAWFSPIAAGVCRPICSGNTGFPSFYLLLISVCSSRTQKSFSHSCSSCFRLLYAPDVL
ncbi:beta-1,4-galactosyltransferase 1 isoform X4 [Gasterosteus aculeatus]